MPVWPFGRRRRNEDGPQSVAQEKTSVRDNVRPVTPRSQGLGRKKSRKHGRKKRRKSSAHKSTKNGEEIANPGRSSASLQRNIDITALPAASPLSQSPHLRPVTVRDKPPPIPDEYKLNLDSTASLPPSSTPREQSKWQRPQSFQRPDSMLTRKKSTKRKADIVREEEVRAMSAPVPIKRPATYSGSVLRRDTKKMKDGLNKNFERPMSEVSLPLEESIHSSMSGTTDIRGFQVSSFDVFTARPRLRYSASMSVPPNGLQPIALSSPTVEAAQKGKTPMSRGEHTSNRTIHATDRIGELADDMNASSLREILERDARRRAKKKLLDEEKLRRKLERRAEKQRAKEARAKEPRQEPEQGTLERRDPVAGLGIDEPKASSDSLPLSAPHDAIMDDVPAEEFFEAQEAPGSLPFELGLDELSPPDLPSPSPLQTPTEEPIVATAQAIRYSRGSFHQSPPVSATHARQPSNISYLPDLRSESVPKHPPHEASDVDSNAGRSRKRTNSEASSKRMGAWASILRRATFSRKRSSDRGRTSPSQLSFTNTSRESMSRQPAIQHLVQSPSPASHTRASGPPGRTSSKFREDLPELPLSPPDSRVQSPEFEQEPPPIPPISARRGLRAPSNIETEPVRQQPSPEDDRYTVAPESRAASPTSPQRASGLMSRSIASVDSEGSWLSGKPVKRPSTRQKYRSSLSSRPTNEGSNDEIFETANESSEENDIHEDIHDDEYFRRFTPTPEHRTSTGSDAVNRKPSSIALASGTLDVEEQSAISRPPRPLSGDEILHTGVARIPTLVQHPTARVKSSEGLVNLFEDGEIAKSSTLSQAEGHGDQRDPNEEHEYQFERAKSIELGRSHARQVSAGSAKLLNIKRIGSRNSAGPSSPPSSSRFDVV